MSGFPRAYDEIAGRRKSRCIAGVKWSVPILLALLPPATWAAGSDFVRPAESERLQALGDLSGEPTSLRRLLQPDDDFPPIRLPGPHDWLTYHRERGQTFEEFRTEDANRPDRSRRIIYLQPIGGFPEEGSPSMPEMRRYAAAFFQLEVKMLPVYDPHDLEFEPRKNPRSGQRQLLTRRIMEFLKKRLPDDAFCVLGITMADLYPDESWNYVFGEASMHERVGVYSLARYDPTFWEEERGRNYRDTMLQRADKVLVHETGHMFGLAHCIHFDCVMNGTNGLSEMDGVSPHLCPICLRKLQNAAGFDAVKRYEQLARYYRRHHWFDEYDWVNRRLAKVKSGETAAGK